MRPPICAICNKDFRHSTKEGGLIQFALTENDKKFNERFKERGFVGHPKGKEWFCGNHIDWAKANKHLTFQEAIKNYNESTTSKQIDLSIHHEEIPKSSYQHISDKLKSRKFYLDNLCSSISSNIYIFYSHQYFVITKFVNGDFTSLKIYTTAQWDYIVLLQERFNNWEKNLQSITKLPFKIEKFDFIFQQVISKLDTIKNNQNKVIGLPMYNGEFHAVYLPFAGYFFCRDSSLPPKFVSRLGYFDRKSDVSPVTTNMLSFYVFKELWNKKAVPILAINSTERERITPILEKIKALKNKGFDFEKSRCFKYTSATKTKIVIQRNNTFYFIEKSSSQLLIERIPTIFALDVCLKIYEKIDIVTVCENIEKWETLITPKALNSLFYNNKNATISFGEFEDSFESNSDKTISRKYDNQNKNLLRHLTFLDANDWFLKLEISTA